MYHILVVDDETRIRSLIRKYAEFEGHTVTEAGDGMEAVLLCRKQQFDLVIMDITMPNMDGLEALKAIRGKDGSANVVMCSAMGQESMVMDAVRSGAKDFIVKPFKPDRVLKTVNTILGG